MRVRDKTRAWAVIAVESATANRVESATAVESATGNKAASAIAAGRARVMRPTARAPVTAATLAERAEPETASATARCRILQALETAARSAEQVAG